jgi:hypothetical protein
VIAVLRDAETDCGAIAGDFGIVCALESAGLAPPHPIENAAAMPVTMMCFADIT